MKGGVDWAVIIKIANNICQQRKTPKIIGASSGAPDSSPPTFLLSL